MCSWNSVLMIRMEMFKHKYGILFLILKGPCDFMEGFFYYNYPCTTEILFSSAITANEGDEVIIECPLDGSYTLPTWTGPNTLADPLMFSSNFREPGMQWANGYQDIKIEKVSIRHNGTYTCEDGSGNKASINLEIEYFKKTNVYFEPAFATAANSRMRFVCSAYSNPPLDIQVDMNTQYASTEERVCEQDPNSYNMNKCTQTTTWNATKRDNGKQQSCTFTYRDVKTTEQIKVNFTFPPTEVKIVGNMNVTEGGVLALTCSTDSANPVSSLRWKIGENNEDLPREVLQRRFEPNERDAEFNGKNVTQEVILNVNNEMNEETVFCCAGVLCDSVTLSIHLPASEGTIVTAWTSCLVLAFATTLM